MLYFIVFIVVAILFILSKSSRNLYYILFSLAMLTISIVLFANIIYILRVSTFTYSYSAVLPLYTYIMRLPIGLSDIKHMLNIALSMFVCLSAALFLHDIKYAVHPTRDITAASVFIVCALFVTLYLQSPGFFETVYIAQNTGRYPPGIDIHFIVTALTYITCGLCLVPIFKILYQIRITKILYKKRLLTTLFTMAILSYTLFFAVLFFLPINNIIIKNDIYSFYGWADKRVTTYTFWTCLVCVAGMIGLIVIFRFDLLNNKILKQNSKKNSAIIFAEDIRHVFHTYKNALFSIKTIAEKAISIYGTPKGMELLTTIRAQVDEFSKKAGRFLDIYNKVEVEYTYTNIHTCLYEALHMVQLPGGIRVEFEFPNDSMFFFGDKELMREAFVNLLSNAVDAISKKKTAQGLITIGIWEEPPWLCIRFIDNGIGISRKIRKRIFKPLYSTKSTFQNWGLGLSYVQNVVTAHSGYIDFKSVPGKGTEFQIILPL